MKGIVIFMASVVAAAGVGVVAYQSNGFTNWNTNTWFGGKAPTEQSDAADKTPETDNSLVITPGANVAVRKLERAEYAASGVPEDTYGAYTLSVIVEPDNAYVKTATWSAAWHDPDSSWATGKTVSDYITMSVTSGASTTISCNAPFGETIDITAVSDGNSALSATCSVDFRKRAEGFKIYENAGGMGYVIPEIYTVDYGNEYSFIGEHSYGIGTVEADKMCESAAIKISLSDELITALQAANVTIDPYFPPGEAYYNPTTKRYHLSLNSTEINRLASAQYGAGVINDVCSNPKFWECVQTVDKHISLTYSYKYSGQYEGGCVRYLKLNVPPTGVSISETSIVF